MFVFDRLFVPTTQILKIEGIHPRLASWDAKSHPSQVRLKRYLDDLQSRIPTLPVDTKFYLQLQVDVEDKAKLIRHHDVENYLPPLFRCPALHHRLFPLVMGSKHVGGGSRLAIGSIEEVETSDLGQDWNFLSLNAGCSPDKKQWKQSISEFIEQASPIQIESNPQVEFHMAFRCSTRRNWVNLWKPAGDALYPILGQNGSNKFSPNDDRITSLQFHRIDDDTVGNDVHVAYWWRVL